MKTFPSSIHLLKSNYIIDNPIRNRAGDVDTGGIIWKRLLVLVVFLLLRNPSSLQIKGSDDVYLLGCSGHPSPPSAGLMEHSMSCENWRGGTLES